ncbi:hypothetical protein ACQKWADRAFT_299862 [Trichoderma austrokoningii]
MATPAAELNAPGEITSRPLRILVQTITGLVPGTSYLGRIESIRNIICQHFWNKDYDKDVHRFHSYNAEFGYPNKRCYFLMDYGHSDIDPPILWYEWTGESLIPINQVLPSRIKSILKTYSFERVYGPRNKPKPLDNIAHREMIRWALACEVEIREEDKDFLRDHPEDVRWLKNKLEPRFWIKIEHYCKGRTFL